MNTGDHKILDADIGKIKVEILDWRYRNEAFRSPRKEYQIKSIKTGEIYEGWVYGNCLGEE